MHAVVDLNAARPSQCHKALRSNRQGRHDLTYSSRVIAMGRRCFYDPPQKGTRAHVGTRRLALGRLSWRNKFEEFSRLVLGTIFDPP